jgi:hypothetical protein
MSSALEALSTEEANTVRQLIRERGGVIPAAKELDLSPQSTAKLAAEIPVSRAVATHARVMLAKL